MSTPYDAWEDQLDERPDDWVLRAIYADWLDENNCDALAYAQRFMAKNQKYPGPPCFIAHYTYIQDSWFNWDQAGKKWVASYSEAFSLVIKEEWCLPELIFKRLAGFLIGRGEAPDHNNYVRSYPSRRNAEIALALALKETI